MPRVTAFQRQTERSLFMVSRRQGTAVAR